MGPIGMRDGIVAAAMMFAMNVANAVPTHADEFPSKPIRLIVPFAPGGPSDIAARAIAEALRNVLGQPTIIENKPGAGAVVATQSVLHAPADGYTLMMASNNFVIGKLLYKHLPFDSLRDLRAIIGVTRSPHFVLVAPTFPGKRVSDLIRVAKQQPGKLSYASAGVGTVPHLAAELLKQRLGFDMIHVPYLGSAPALTDLMSGQVQVYIDLVLSAQSHVRAGTVKALGVTTKNRLAEFPKTPTLEEQGVKDYEVTSWFGIVARAETPDAIVVRLNTAVDKVLQLADVRDRFVSMGAIPIGGSPDLFREMIETEYRMWGPVISTAGIALDLE
jgi:tripartite-type tricarboxylate transporter receptor subunit TctC